MKAITKIIFALLFFAVPFSACQKEILSNSVTTNLMPPVAHAGASQTISQPASTASLNGTATSTNGPLLVIYGV